MREVILHGELRRKYGHRFNLAVSTPAEAVRALCANFRHFEADLMGAKDRGTVFAVWSDGENIPADKLKMRGSGPIRIAPVIAGSKRGGVLQTILGAVLVIIGIVLLYTPFAAAGPFAIELGIGLMVGGIIQMLSPVPKAPGSQEGSKSTSFTGAVNTAPQGVPVPILLGGPLLIGSVVISASLHS